MEKQFITYQLAEFTKKLTFEDLDAKTIENVKRFLLDSIGCAFGGSQTHDVKIMLDFYNEIGGKEETTVINSAQNCP